MPPTDLLSAQASRLVAHHRSLPADVLAALGLLGAVLLFFARLAFTNLIVARGDMFLYFYPYWSYAADAVRHGHIPLWNPYLFMGAPFLANSQAGVLYPLNLALAWLPTTRAINVSVILHLWLAGIGIVVFARRSVGLGRLGAWVSGATFALGGYLAAQIEHVNQLQALAWMPLLFTFLDLALERWRWVFALAAVVAMQLLAGHTQSVFISLVGLSVYALWPIVESVAARRWNSRDLARRLGLLIVTAILGALLSAAQLLPTLELARESLRSGGLSWREAVSFSLKPAMLLQALLPNYRAAIFSEYVAYVGVIGVMLMALGVWACWSKTARDRRRTASEIRPLLVVGRASSVLMLLGVFLALGAYNPLYSLLVQFAPGFNLFRVPARWLVLYAFGAAILAGLGLQQTSNWLYPSHPEQRLAGPRRSSGASDRASERSLVSRQRCFASPSMTRRLGLKFGLAVLFVADLFFASRPLDYNHPTAPDALADLRPSVAYLLAAQADQPPFRFLSISPILFDPGDSAELASIFADQLPADTFYDLLIATKQKEIIAPNLPLYYRLSAADGYDGGVLPLRNYTTFQQLFVPLDKISPDGRLRENLRNVPDGKWLSLMNVRYVITDKTLDAWLDDVFYDLQFTTALGPSAASQASVAHVPRFEATALGFVSYLEGAANLPDGAPVAEVTIGFAGGLTRTFTLRAGVDTAEGIYAGAVAHKPAQVGGHFVRDHPEVNDYVTRLRFDGLRVATSVVVRPLLRQGHIVVRGASLIDERTGGFQSLVISGRGRFQLVHSGDVKIYENLDVLPRAFIVPRARAYSDDAAALIAMQDPAFEPAQVAALSGTPAGQDGALPATANILSYQPERIVIETSSASAGWLVLTDAWYPGWRATIDGAPVEIARADVLFRAVPLPAGSHRVEFTYHPLSFRAGVAISVATPIACILGLWQSTDLIMRRFIATRGRNSRIIL